MTGKLLVYSCVTGSYDDVYAGILASKMAFSEGTSYALYTDQLAPGSPTRQYKLTGAGNSWELRPLLWQHPLCKRRTARWHKANSHLIPDDVEHTLWIDGSQQIKEGVLLRSQLVEPLQDMSDLASFKHPERTCVYQELMACRRWKKDNFALMKQQMETYKEEGYPPYNGLVETACVLRAHRKTHVTQFNQLWWQQMDQHSFRDQLSFNYTAWKLGHTFGIIPGHRTDSPYFDYVPHKHG